MTLLRPPSRLPRPRAAVGRCPGALADALLRLAEGLRGARLTFLKDLRTRLLTLFSGELQGTGAAAWRGIAGRAGGGLARSVCLGSSAGRHPTCTIHGPCEPPSLPPASLSPADFALVLPNPSYVADLGALLPAVGAAGEAVAAAAPGPTSGACEGV